MTRPAHVLVLFAALSAACNLGTMHPGESCARCHDGGGPPRFGAAGTVYAPGSDDGIPDVTVEIADSRGESVSVRSNEVGNFYTERSLTPPLRVTVLRAGFASASATVASGDCNSCHTSGSATGRLHIP